MKVINQMKRTILTIDIKAYFFQNYNKFMLLLNISQIFSVFCNVNTIKIWVLILGILPWISQSQDVQYSQFYATQMALNPAFTGATKYARLTLAQRSQWLSSPGKVVSYLAAYDRFFYYQKLGLGGVLQYDRLASGLINNLHIGPSASYIIYTEKGRSLRLGLGLAYVNKRYEVPSYVFADQLDPDFGLVASRSSDHGRFTGESKSYMDAHTGVLYNSENFWIGAAAHHFNRPAESVQRVKYKTPVKLGLHTGYKIEFVDNKGLAYKEERHITFAANLKHQGKSTQLDIGSYVILEPITFGCWYRGIPLFRSQHGYINQDAIIAVIGLEYQSFRLGYSYDITISKLGMQTGGTHEISLLWEFGDVSDPKKRKPGKMKTMYMPYPKL